MQITVATNGDTFQEALMRARAVALAVFVDEAGEVQPFTEGSVDLRTKAPAEGEVARFSGRVTFSSSEQFGVVADHEGTVQSIHLPGVDTTDLTVKGEPLADILVRLDPDEPIIVTPPGKEAM